MSIIPVTNHPAFVLATQKFQAATELASPSAKKVDGFPVQQMPSKGDLREAISLATEGVTALKPLTEPSDAWMHGAAMSAIANAKEAISILDGVADRVRAATTTTVSTKYASELSQARIGLGNALEAASQFA